MNEAPATALNRRLQALIEADFDYRQFIHWATKEEQRTFWDVPGTRRHYLKKIGRNEPCPLRQQTQIQEPGAHFFNSNPGDAPLQTIILFQ